MNCIIFMLWDIYYHISNDYTPAEKTWIRKTLNDPRGWAGLGYRFHSCRSDDDRVTVVIYKKDPRWMFQYFRGAYQGLSVTETDIRGRSSRIYINAKNWRDVPVGFVGSRTVYRQYVIQHEMGHALGYHHKLPRGMICPVMYQQTHGTMGICEANPWITRER